MIEVTCFHCGQAVLISPDVTRCAECGANLRRLIDAEQATNYFYTRASAFADAGNLLHAVQEVQRGVTFQRSAELNLLGAILAKRLNRVDQMRQFVAAVPVDSPLRGEAEWLLRANQVRTYLPVDVPTDADLLPPRAERDRRQRAESGPQIQPVAWLMMLALLALGGWWGWHRLPPDWMSQFEVVATARQPEGAPVTPTVAGISDSVDVGVAAGATTPVQPALDTATIPAVTTAAAGPVAPLRLPTPTIAPDLVSAPTAAQPVAAADPAAAAVAAAAQDVNLVVFLEQQGRADLAALPVQARLEGKRLVLEGTVESVGQRAELEQYVKLMPDIPEISMLNVRVRLPATYTVQSGDSLWAISMNLYGEPGMIEEIYAANRTVMNSPGALSVGMVLAVPEKP